MILSRHIQGVVEQLYLLSRFSAEDRQKTLVLIDGCSRCSDVIQIHNVDNLVLEEIVDKPT